MDFSDIVFVRLEHDYNLKSFNCEDSDLNDFFHNDSKDHHKDLITVTYIFESKSNNETIAFYSLLNDKITIDNFDSKNQYKKHIKNKMITRKKYESYPSVKIARFAVSQNHKGKKIGSSLIDIIKRTFITNNRTGCRYITVDAYGKSIGFYQKNGFLFLTKKDIKEDTRLMYFDLINLQD
ncbi:MAG: GNAT family N-acetyltransferase [Bacteroidales bacterium]